MHPNPFLLYYYYFFGETSPNKLLRKPFFLKTRDFIEVMSGYPFSSSTSWGREG
jgi:hypothetical protein